ncbi:MAG: T9SS type A sorting domain-containing protein, partial [Candidatus Marinimicrobia bacterium]|nr:T9SS type A sorting domain-containing protein [Candidatus Neomarinimicrobiota bacterium]
TFLTEIWSDRLYIYDNIGDAINAEFVLADSLDFLPETGAYPEFCDIDFDGDPDLFIGKGTGGLQFYRNQEYSSVNGKSGTVNRSFTLLPNYPNPFNSRTMITFEVSESVNYRLVIYDLMGCYINTLSAGEAVIGKYGIPWDGRDANNNLVASGSYLYLLITPGYNIAKKMQLIK